MAELVDAADSKSAASDGVGVRVPLPAPRYFLTNHIKSYIFSEYQQNVYYNPSINDLADKLSMVINFDLVLDLKRFEFKKVGRHPATGGMQR